MEFLTLKNNMTRFHLYVKRQWGDEHVTSLLAENEEQAKQQIIEGLLWGNRDAFDEKYFISTNGYMQTDLGAY